MLERCEVEVEEMWKVRREFDVKGVGLSEWGEMGFGNPSNRGGILKEVRGWIIWQVSPRNSAVQVIPNGSINRVLNTICVLLLSEISIFTEARMLNAEIIHSLLPPF